MNFLLFIFMFAILSHPTEEKTGGLTGTVLDATNEISLANINVNILSTTHQQLTDDNGSFEFKDLIPGVYDIEFKSIWYQPLKLDSIEVKADERIVLKVSLLKINNEALIKAFNDEIDMRGGLHGSWSRMIIVKPDPNIDYKILVIEPDSTIDYK
jgi:hypothetical protein